MDDVVAVSYECEFAAPRQQIDQPFPDWPCGDALGLVVVVAGDLTDRRRPFPQI